MIHKPSCDVILTSFSVIIRLKTVTQYCNASVKQFKFVPLIGFGKENKDKHVLVVFW